MVVENFVNFSEWIGPAAGISGLLLIAATVLGLFFGYLIASFRHGPFEAFYVVAQVCADAPRDFLGTSFSRVMAIARLAIKEALRRRIILVTFGIFALALLFGGWFMSGGSDHPDRIYINFVFWGTQLLVLMMGLLISAFSLPDDIKKKTIYTIVTKPVRATEIVIGRIVGFGLMGTGLLALMGVISYLFVLGGLSHTHQIAGDTNTIAEFRPVTPGTELLEETGRRVSANAVMIAMTGFNSDHRHRVEVIEEVRTADKPPKYQDNILRRTTRIDGKIVYQRVVVVPTSGHYHAVKVLGERPTGTDTDFYAGDDAEIRLGPALGYFEARVPSYCSKVQFYDRHGEPSAKGINTGSEWEYRGSVEGGSPQGPSSLSRAAFQFEDFREGNFRNPEVLPLEMTLEIFRTNKGDIEKRVNGSLQFQSRFTGEETGPTFLSDPIHFETNEYTIQEKSLSRKQKGRRTDPDGTVTEGVFDLYDDYAANGNLDLVIRCEDRGQYIGVARADIYFRAADRAYWFNFLKGYLGIWCQMMVIISMGVAFSTFLSTPIVMLSSLVAILLGFCTPFVREMLDSDSVGGGPIESFIRLATQKNMQVDLETGVMTTLIDQVDYFLILCLNALTYIVPDFSQFAFSNYLEYGYSIDNNRILVSLAVTVTFCIGLSVLGYFFLKTREIAK